MFPTFVKNNWTATPPPESFVRAGRVTALPQAALSRTSPSLSRLLALLDNDEDVDQDDYGQIGPTQFAFKTAYQMIENTEQTLGTIPACSLAVDSEGGIRAAWTINDRQVKLICPATRRAPMYIYHSSAEGSSVQDQNVTASALANRIAWLKNREPSIVESAT
jgi:hypothetical protein